MIWEQSSRYLTAAAGEAYIGPASPARGPQGRAKAECGETCQVKPSGSCGPGHPLRRLESESVWLVTNDLSQCQLLHRNIITHRREIITYF